MIAKINYHHFRQALSSMTKIGEDEYPYVPDDERPISDFNFAIETGRLRPPVNFNNVFFVPERIAIFTDIQKKRRSRLVQLLLDREGEIALIADPFLKGKDALYLTTLVEQDFGVVNDWLNHMNPVNMSLTVKSIDVNYKIMVASLSSFTVPLD